MTVVTGEINGAAKLTRDAVERILADRRAQTAIAADYGVGQTLISQIKRRIIWQHVEVPDDYQHQVIRREVSIYNNYIPVPESGCWLWLGRWNRAGYGKTPCSDGSRSTHRLFYEKHKGPIPPGLLVCHKCDTPACCNPDHLYAGTHAQNSRDMWNRGRARPFGRIPRIMRKGGSDGRC